MSPDIVNSIVTAIIGLGAYGIFWLTKRTEKRNAATVVIMDIRHAEQVVLSILDKGVDQSVQNILYENNWEKYKHLFASDFSFDDFAAFNRFFESCTEIAEARERLKLLFDSGLQAKAAIAQQKIFAIDNLSSAEGQKKKQEVLNDIHSDTYTFQPHEPQRRIEKSLRSMGHLSNTVAFEKLKKHAGMRV